MRYRCRIISEILWSSDVKNACKRRKLVVADLPCELYNGSRRTVLLRRLLLGLLSSVSSRDKIYRGLEVLAYGRNGSYCYTSCGRRAGVYSGISRSFCRRGWGR